MNSGPNHLARNTAEVAHRVSQTAQESIGVLPQDRLAVSLGGISQHHPEYPGFARVLAVPFGNRRVLAEVPMPPPLVRILRARA